MRWLLFVLAVGCGDKPTPTGTPCGDQGMALTWDNFGQSFMQRYCTSCHAVTLVHSQRHGAPTYHDFDSLYGVMEVAVARPDHIDEQAGWGPNAHNNFMPGDGTDGKCPSVPGGALDEDCPVPTSDERVELAQWIACEKDRPHDFIDAGS